MKKNKLSGVFMLTLTALIWGTAFVAQSVGMNYIGPFTFAGTRYMIGAVVLLPVIMFRNSIYSNKGPFHNRKTLLFGGICCGSVLCIASGLQQVGIIYTTVGKAGFITAIYVVLVPLLGIFLKKNCPKKIWYCVICAFIGLYLLCMTDRIDNINIGDIIIFLGSIGFAVHILVVDYFSPRCDGVKLSCLQFFFAGFFSFIIMFFFETPNFKDVLSAWFPIIYTGMFSCGIAYTLQIIAQKNVEPTLASLLMSLESVFAVLAGWVLLDQHLSGKEILGCILMFAAIIYANIPDQKTLQ